MGALRLPPKKEACFFFGSSGSSRLIAAQPLLWRQMARLADWVHEAFGEVDARMAPAEFAVDVAQIAAEEVVNTGGEEQDGARLFGQVCEDVCDACED